MSGFVIETQRLGLRRLTVRDLDDMAALLGDPDVMRFYPGPKTRAESQQWIEWNLDLYERNGFGLWAVILADDGQFLGDCGLVEQHVDGERLVEIGYHIKRSHWRRGYASEAAIACRDYAFDSLDETRVISLIRPENLPSQGVARKVGMSVWKETQFKGLHHLVFALDRPNHSR